MAAFRAALAARGFTEIQSPKLVASATEGGANVFRLDYFGGDLLVPTPVKAPGGVGELGGVTRLHTSAWTVCARVQNGRALCWGAGDDGQLGQPALGDEDLPVPVEV